MKRAGLMFAAIVFLVGVMTAVAAETSLPAGSIPRSRLEPTDIRLLRPAQTFTPFDKVGRKFALLGYESGSFEVWAYPLKILRNFEFSFLVGTSTVPIQGREIVRFISVDPAVTTLTFTYQSFTVRALYVASVSEPGAVILLEVDSREPLTVVCSFLPVLQPMWPAGLGGQYAYWNDAMKAYLISEPTGKNHGFVGSPAARGISYTPAHMLSDTPNQFKIEIPDPKAIAGVSLPIILAGGKGKLEDVKAVYQKLAANPEACYSEAVGHYERMRRAGLQVKTPNSEMNSAFEWAKVALDNLLVDNPDLGRGMIAGLGVSGTGGRPGFGWFFGTDAYLNSLSLNSLGIYQNARDALAFTEKWQRKDGKMAHELSQAAGYVNWWTDYPYGYIHADTTPYYIVAVEDYVRLTGDIGFLKARWPSLVRAFDWCLTTDEDGDGLMDNTKAGLGALEFGALTGIRTDIYLACVWTKAAQGMIVLAEAAGDQVVAAKARGAAAKAAKALGEKFWDKANGQYAYGFNKDGRLVPELTPWSAVVPAWALGEKARGTATLVKMNAADLTSDWGIRMLSTQSPYFEPLNYNYGAAWPFLTGWVSTALLKDGFSAQGFAALLGTVRHTFDNSLGSITELFSGGANIWPQEAVPHQGFSTSGVALPFVRGLLGLDGDALGKTVAFEPCLPVHWPDVSVSNWKIGGSVLALDYNRQETTITLRVRSTGAAGFKLVFAPALGLGTKILRASLNGASLPFSLEPSAPSAQAVRPRMQFNLTRNDTVVLVIDPAPEIVPPDAASRTGDLNRGLKVLSTTLDGSLLKFVVEGLAGEVYRLELRNTGRIASVTGADFDGRSFVVKFSEGKHGEFAKREIIVRLKT